jgi:hypothetical protein
MAADGWEFAYLDETLGAYRIHGATYSAEFGPPQGPGYVQGIEIVSHLNAIKLQFLKQHNGAVGDARNLRRLAEEARRRELVIMARNLTLPERRTLPTFRALAEAVRADPGVLLEAPAWKLAAASLIGPRLTDRTGAAGFYRGPSTRLRASSRGARRSPSSSARARRRLALAKRPQVATDRLQLGGRALVGHRPARAARESAGAPRLEAGRRRRLEDCPRVVAPCPSRAPRSAGTSSTGAPARSASSASGSGGDRLDRQATIRRSQGRRVSGPAPPGSGRRLGRDAGLAQHATVAPSARWRARRRRRGSGRGGRTRRFRAERHEQTPVQILVRSVVVAADDVGDPEVDVVHDVMRWQVMCRRRERA